MLANTRRTGFTIVEIMVVVAVLAGLALIVIFAFGNWREQTAKAEVRTALAAAKSAMDDVRNFSNQYPTSIPGTYKTVPGVNVVFNTGGDTDPATFCILGTSTKVPSVTMSVTHNREISNSVCP